MLNMHLNLFTNCTINAPDISVIKTTHDSFIKTFGAIPFTIYVDPSPNLEAYDEYVQKLYDHFGGQIIETSGLADGYVKSIEEGNADYLFQLEHDWVFQNVNHSLKQILDVMEAEHLYYFRFNKFENQDFEWLRKWQSYLRPRKALGMDYCLTDNLSNNPHIIDRKYYLKTMLKRIERDAEGALGIEQNLEKKGFYGGLYGGLGYPPTTVHIDGRKGRVARV